MTPGDRLWRDTIDAEAAARRIRVRSLSLADVMAASEAVPGFQGYTGPGALITKGRGGAATALRTGGLFPDFDIPLPDLTPRPASCDCPKLDEALEDACGKEGDQVMVGAEPWQPDGIGGCQTYVQCEDRTSMCDCLGFDYVNMNSACQAAYPGYRLDDSVDVVWKWDPESGNCSGEVACGNGRTTTYFMRSCGGGTVTTRTQRFIGDECLTRDVSASLQPSAAAGTQRPRRGSGGLSDSLPDLRPATAFPRLNCYQVYTPTRNPVEWSACEAYCASKKGHWCALSCFRVANTDGDCELYANCTRCGEALPPGPGAFDEEP